MKYLSFGLIILIFSLGCGSSKGTGGDGGCCGIPGINVKVVSPTGSATLDDNPTLNLPITVQVTNDSANAGVAWTLSPVIKNGPTGTLSGQQAFSATYNPPTGVTSPLQVTITATSVTDPTRSAIIPVTVYPPLAFGSGASNLTTAFLNTNYTCVQYDSATNSLNQTSCLTSVSGGLGPYTWSLGNTLLPPGLQWTPAPTPAPGAASSAEIIGIPTAVGIYSFSLTVTDATGNTATLPLNLNVAPAQLKVATPTVMSLVADPQNQSQGLPYAPVQFQATGGVPPYMWSVVTTIPNLSTQLPAGMSLSSSGVISGTPNPLPGTPSTFAVQVTDSQTPVPAQAVFPAPTIAGSSSNTIPTLGVSDINESLDPCTSAGNTTVLPSTPYAFVFSGFDKDGPVTFSGSFTADASGNLTGVEDIVRSTGAQFAQPLTSGSSILFNVVASGCLTLNTSGSSSQFRVAPTTLTTAYLDGRIVEFDDANGTGTRGTGYFRVQTAPFGPPSGPFAFRFSGWDAGTNHFAMAGTATAQAGSLSAVVADVNDGGTFAGPLNGGGTISAPDANGRGTAVLSAGSTTYDLVYYIVDANHLILNSAQVVSIGHPLITGEAITSAGPFSQATLSNSHIYRFGGDISSSTDVAVGVLHFDGLGAVSGTNYERNGGVASATTVSAQYVVDPATGRLTFAGTGTPVVGYAVPSASGITGYLVGTGLSAASGTMEFQTNSYPPGYKFNPFLNSSGQIGHYGLGTEEMLDPQSTVIAGLEHPSQSGLSGTASESFIYSSSLTGLVPLQEFNLFKYTWAADGSGIWGGSTYMVTNGSKIFYIDTSPLNAHPGVVVGQLQH